MSILDSTVRTITCNGPQCHKSVTFFQKDNEQVVRDHDWLLSLLIVVAYGQNFCFCSKMCVANALGSDTLDAPQQKKIIEMPTSGSGDAAIRAAAQAQAKAAEVTRNIKDGQPVTL